MRKIEVDQNTAVTFKGRHREIPWLVTVHSFKETADFYDHKEMWATYILLSEENHEKYKDRINSLPWHWGQTYYRKHTEEHVNAPTDFAEKWNRPYYKIGDDFCHLYDNECRYTREDMERHIKRVIDAMLDGTTEER